MKVKSDYQIIISDVISIVNDKNKNVNIIFDKILIIFNVDYYKNDMLYFLYIKRKKGGYKMNKEKLKKDWQKFLIDIDETEKSIAASLNTPASNLNRKINDGTIKYVELSEIVEKYGYSIDIHKKP